MKNKKQPKPFWVVDYYYTCCDTGGNYRRYTFDTQREAEEFYQRYLNDVEKSGVGWSDGPENMSKPWIKYPEECSHW